VRLANMSLNPYRIFPQKKKKKRKKQKKKERKEKEKEKRKARRALGNSLQLNFPDPLGVILHRPKCKFSKPWNLYYSNAASRLSTTCAPLEL